MRKMIRLMMHAALRALTFKLPRPCLQPTTNLVKGQVMRNRMLPKSVPNLVDKAVSVFIMRTNFELDIREAMKEIKLGYKLDKQKAIIKV